MRKFKKEGYTYRAGDYCTIVKELTSSYIEVTYTSIEGYLSTCIVKKDEITS